MPFYHTAQCVSCGIGMLTAGMYTRAVARELNVHFSTISRLQRHFREFGSTSNRPCNCRPHVTTPVYKSKWWGKSQNYEILSRNYEIKSLNKYQNIMIEFIKSLWPKVKIMTSYNYEIKILNDISWNCYKHKNYEEKPWLWQISEKQLIDKI